jgi:hypothetical protein
MDAADRFVVKFDRSEGGCWLWTAAVSEAGYGVFSLEGGANAPAHRFSYELYRGAIPDGLSLDHLCRVRRCVNPWHLEPVTHKVNVQRGFAARRGTFVPLLIDRDPTLADLPVTDVDLPDFSTSPSWGSRPARAHRGVA